MITVKKDAFKFKNSNGQMQSAGALCKVGILSSGGNENDVWNYITNYGYMFYKTVFPEDYTLELNIALNEAVEPAYVFNRTFANTVAKKVVLKGYIDNTPVPLVNTFQNAKYEEVDLSDFKCIINRLTSTFQYGGDRLKTIRGELDLSACTIISSAFDYCYVLEDVTFKPNTIPLTVLFAQSSKLSDASIQSIIDGLADLTGGDAQTLTVHKDVEAKMSDEQKAQITSKNWTLAA